MTKVAEKLVLSLDAESQSYKPTGHNLTASQAVELTDKLQAEGKGSLVIDQQGHHRALSFHQCKPCKKCAEDATSKHSQTSGQEQEEQETASVSEESESE